MNIVHFVANHLGMVLGTTIGGGFVLGLAKTYLPAMIGKQVERGLEAGLAELHAPADIAAAKAILLAIDARFPEAGDSKFAQTADAIIKWEPVAAPMRQWMIDFFTAVDVAVKTVVEKEAK